MSDDRLDELLQAATRDYHRPPQPPREEMWAVIEAERRRRHTAPRVVVLRPAWRWAIGMAAVLLLGIAIGRWLRSGASGDGFVTASSVASRDDGLAYRLVTAQYLNRTETLLTGFSADARTGQVDAQFAAQARLLLGSTRLLLDSPAGRDPQLKPLLEDLELVLAQIAVLPASGESQEVKLITEGIDQRSVLTRLRTAIPAGPATTARAQGVL